MLQTIGHFVGGYALWKGIEIYGTADPITTIAMTAAAGFLANKVDYKKIVKKVESFGPIAGKVTKGVNRTAIATGALIGVKLLLPHVKPFVDTFIGIENIRKYGPAVAGGLMMAFGRVLGAPKKKDDGATSTFEDEVKLLLAMERSLAK